MGERVAIVIDGSGQDSLVLAEDALDQLGAFDRVAVIDASPARVMVPMIPAADRSLAEATLERNLRTLPRGDTNLGEALRLARAALGASGKRRIVILTDGRALPNANAELSTLAYENVIVSAIGSREGVDPALAESLVTAGGVAHVHPSIESRRAAMRFVVPAAGLLAFNETILEFRGNPAPSHVIETSGGGVRWRLDAGELVLGDVRWGEARTEVVRVTVPPFAPNTRFTFEVSARARDVSSGEERRFGAEISSVYDDDIERIAQSRNGDVIAYASALATVKRLDGAFNGPDIERAGGIWQIARMHAQSMTLLARDTGDRAIQDQAEMLNAVVGTVGPLMR